jgi:hypothetical protein
MPLRRAQALNRSCCQCTSSSGLFEKRSWPSGQCQHRHGGTEWAGQFSSAGRLRLPVDRDGSRLGVELQARACTAPRQRRLSAKVLSNPHLGPPKALRRDIRGGARGGPESPMALAVALLSAVACVMSQPAHTSIKALVLGVDGGKAPYVVDTCVQSGKCPTIQQLMAQGCASVCSTPTDPTCARAHYGNRFGSLPPTSPQAYSSDYEWVTSPGWLSVLTGVQNYKHGVQGNDIGQQQRYSNQTRHTYWTMFRYARNVGLRTAASGAPNFLSAYDGDLPNATCNFGIVDYECGATADGPAVACTAESSCNLDHRLGLVEDASCDARTTQFATEHVAAGDADLIMTHFDLVDHNGHEFGWGSPQQLAQMSTVDGQIGSILQVVQAAADKNNESWLVVLTADHGGLHLGHGSNFNDDEAVPLIVGVINGNQTQPYHLLPMQHPAHHFDVMPTVLRWFGIPFPFDSNPAFAVDGMVQGLHPDHAERVLALRAGAGPRGLRPS